MRINFKCLIIMVLLLVLPINVLAACNQWASQGKTICESKSFEGKQCAWDSSKKGGSRCYKSKKAAVVTQVPEPPNEENSNNEQSGNNTPQTSTGSDAETTCNSWASQGATICNSKTYEGYKCAWDGNKKGGARCYKSKKKATPVVPGDGTSADGSNQGITSCTDIEASATCTYSKVNGTKCLWKQGSCIKGTNDGSGETIIADSSDEYSNKLNEIKEQEKVFQNLPPINLSKISCDTVFKNDDGSYNQFYYLFWNALKIAKYAAIALTIGLSLIDFIKVIASGNKDELQKVATKSVKRLIVGVVLFFAPSLLKYIMQIIGDFTTCNLL